MLLWLLFIAYTFWTSIDGSSNHNLPYLLRNDPVYGTTGSFSNIFSALNRCHKFLIRFYGILVFLTVHYACAIISYKQMKAAIRSTTLSDAQHLDAIYRVVDENDGQATTADNITSVAPKL